MGEAGGRGGGGVGEVAKKIFVPRKIEEHKFFTCK